MSLELRCSFCMKSEREVAKLAGGAKAFICDACVEIASQIMQDADPPRERTWARLGRRLRELRVGWRRHSLFQPGA